MKKFYILIITLIISLNINAQCIFTTQVFPWNGVCDTTCNWVLSISANGANGPHYLFLNGNYVTTFTTFSSISQLCTGTYILEITDSAGCNFVDSIVIIQPPQITGTIGSTSPSCALCNDGDATVTVTGGTPPFSFQWSQGSTTQTINNLGMGIYCVTITDATGCTLTLCDSVGGQPGFSIINGYTFIDLDTNGIYQVVEPGTPNIQITANPGGYMAWSSMFGTYNLSVPNGTYNVSINVPSNWQQTSLPISYNITVNDSFALGNHFGLLPDTTSIYGSFHYTAGLPRCYQNIYQAVSFFSYGLQPANGDIIMIMDPQLTYFSSNISPTSVSGNTYTWNFPNIYPYSYNYIFPIFTMPGPGNIINNTVIYNLYDSLSNIAFTDTIHYTDTVKCSYDPNDKRSLPYGLGSQNIVPLSTELDYTIRFQNTGNDTAFVVIIKDTLNNSLDLGTFQIIASSHEMFAQMDPGGILTFTFENILLPDSNVNEPLSHGFVRYGIRPGLPTFDPTVITNTAYIYFDQNPAVVTNTTLTTLSDNLLSVAEIKGSGIIHAYPNPFSDEVLIQFEKSLNAELKLYDFLGRMVRDSEIKNSSSFVLKKENLKAGIYLLKLTNGENFSTMKLIIY